MKSKGLLTASFLLLLLTGVLWWSNKRAARADKEPMESTTTKLVNIPEDQFREIEIKRRSGETVHLQRRDSKWQITAPKSLPADADAVSSMLSTLSSLSSDRTVDDKASSIELTAKKQTITFGRSKDEWQIVKPKPFRADRSQMEELLRTLREAKMDLSASEDEKKVSAAFSSSTPLATARVTDVSGTQELQVRKNKDDYYAESSAVAGIYKISSGTGPGLDKGLDDFRNKKLFDFGFADPDKIELHDGSKNYSLTHSGGDWLSGSAKMDPGASSALIDKIRDLSASKFTETGFTTAAMDLTVTSDGGKRIERVFISKNGENFVAKRQDEPALYELSASVVGDLQKAAADLKPAPPPGKK